MVILEDLRRFPLFDCFDDRYLGQLASRCADLVLSPDEYLFFEGDTAHFYLLLDGAVELRRDVIRKAQVITIFQAGEYFGEVPLLLGSKTLVDAQAKTPVRVARLDPHLFYEFIVRSETCSSTIIKTLLQRISVASKLINERRVPEILIIGDSKDQKSAELRKFMSSVRTPFQWVDPLVQKDRAKQLLGTDLQLPAVFIGGARKAVAPSIRQLANLLELPTEPKRTNYDVVVVGAGPAGLAASVYGASEGLSVLVVDRHAPGGQAGSSSRIENYLGFPGGISGDQLTERALKQAGRFGAEFAITRQVKHLEAVRAGWNVTLDNEEHLLARTVILANGVEWRKLEAENVDHFLGRGVTYGADRAEAPFVAGQEVFVVGGGNSAGQAAMFFSSYAARVTILVRGGSLEKSMSQYLIHQLETKSNILVELQTEVIKADGRLCLETITTVDRETNRITERKASALFVMIGATTGTTWLPEKLARDAKGFLLTGRDLTLGESWLLQREPMPLETSLPKLLAVGDVRHGSVKRVASAVGEGSVAISFIHQILELESV